LDNGHDHLIHLLTEIREVYIFQMNPKHWEKLIPTVQNTQRINVTTYPAVQVLVNSWNHTGWNAILSANEWHSLI